MESIKNFLREFFSANEADKLSELNILNKSASCSGNGYYGCKGEGHGVNFKHDKYNDGLSNNRYNYYHNGEFYNGKGSKIGTGSGDGCCADIKTFCGKPVHYINGIPIVITKAKINFAEGYVVLRSLTTKPYFITKSKKNGFYATGETLRVAHEQLNEKRLRLKERDNEDYDEDDWT